MPERAAPVVVEKGSVQIAMDNALEKAMKRIFGGKRNMDISEGAYHGSLKAHVNSDLRVLLKKALERRNYRRRSQETLAKFRGAPVERVEVLLEGESSRKRKKFCDLISESTESLQKWAEKDYNKHINKSKAGVLKSKKRKSPGAFLKDSPTLEEQALRMFVLQRWSENDRSDRSSIFDIFPKSSFSPGVSSMKRGESFQNQSGVNVEDIKHVLKQKRNKM